MAAGCLWPADYLLDAGHLSGPGCPWPLDAHKPLSVFGLLGVLQLLCACGFRGAQSLFWIVGIHQLLGIQGVPTRFWVPMDSRVAPEQPSAPEHPSSLTPEYLLASGVLGILAPNGDLDPHQLLGTKQLLVPVTPCTGSLLAIPRLLAPFHQAARAPLTHLCQAGIQQ